MLSAETSFEFSYGRYQYTLLAYKEVFQMDPPKLQWPAPKRDAHNPATRNEKSSATDFNTPYQIFIRGLTGDWHNIMVTAGTTVAELEVLIRDKTMVPPESQRLRWSGKLLSNEMINTATSMDQSYFLASPSKSSGRSIAQMKPNTSETATNSLEGHSLVCRWSIGRLSDDGGVPCERPLHCLYVSETPGMLRDSNLYDQGWKPSNTLHFCPLM
ncbi:hypothetical protein PROFUN_14089 [Planoprotostelium fungivorum]|uniref:Ubiquitin-like domain-containing protein n=1 Tax=Planoprotostelium fungivorum TaxID=1890364 RepID=A0A2P6N238_9EUKA|nr:hypothetical protein PROFUN_14089 [Planoprotostelium fungivorum]